MNNNQDLKLLTNDSLTKLARTWNDVLKSDTLSKKEYLQLMSNLHSLESIWDKNYHRNHNHVTTAEPVNDGIQMSLPLDFPPAKHDSVPNETNDFWAKLMASGLHPKQIDYSRQMIDNNDTFRLPNHLKAGFRKLFNQLLVLSSITNQVNVYPKLSGNHLGQAPAAYDNVMTFMDDLLDGKHYSHQDNQKLSQLIDELDITNKYLDKAIVESHGANDYKVTKVYANCKDILSIIRNYMMDYISELPANPSK